MFLRSEALLTPKLNLLMVCLSFLWVGLVAGFLADLDSVLPLGPDVCTFTPVPFSFPIGYLS
jgi:hypothetical protein